MFCGEGNKVNNKNHTKDFFCDLFYASTDIKQYLLPTTLAMQLLNGISVAKQPHAAPAPPRAVSTDMWVYRQWEKVPQRKMYPPSPPEERCAWNRRLCPGSAWGSMLLGCFV